jgi:hypothetical protein
MFTLISAPFIVFSQLEGHVSDSANHFIQEALQLRHGLDEFFGLGEVARVRESFGRFVPCAAHAEEHLMVSLQVEFEDFQGRVHGRLLWLVSHEGEPTYVDLGRSHKEQEAEKAVLEQSPLVAHTVRRTNGSYCTSGSPALLFGAGLAVLTQTPVAVIAKKLISISSSISYALYQSSMLRHEIRVFGNVERQGFSHTPKSIPFLSVLK